MASSQSSHDMWRGRGRQPQTLGNAQPRHRSESRRLYDRRRPVQTAARKLDHYPGALYEGDAVRVFSRSVDKWVDGEVVEFLEGNFVRIEYAVDEDWCGKMLHLHSEHLVIPAGSSDLEEADDLSDFEEADPGVNFVSHSDASYASLSKEAKKDDARSALQHVLMHYPPSSTGRQVASLDGLKFYQNNSFYIQQPRDQPCKISYNGPNDVDILIKVYILQAQGVHQGKGNEHSIENWGEYIMVDYIHAEHKADPVVVEQTGSYFLGFVVHRDLAADFLKDLAPETLQRKMGRCTAATKGCPGGYRGRFEPEAKRMANGTHYLLSRATADTAENNTILESLVTKGAKGPRGRGPITFCTDRSLGIGQHMLTTEEKRELYLGRHGFGQPVDHDVWFGQYQAKAKETLHGLLVVNPSLQYFLSEACRREFWHIESSRSNVYHNGEIIDSGRLLQELSKTDSRHHLLRTAMYELELNQAASANGMPPANLPSDFEMLLSMVSPPSKEHQKNINRARRGHR